MNMAVKKQIFIDVELDWAEQKLLEWKAYVDDNPFNMLDDRTRPTAKGEMLIASVESQIKSLRDTMKDVLSMLDQVNKMRQAEEAKKKELKGGDDRPMRMDK